MRNQIVKSFGLSLILAVVFMIAAPAFGQVTTRTLVISRQTKLGGQPVSEGKYTMAFDEKKDGELTLSRGSKEILKANYKAVELDKPAAENAVVFASAGDGAMKVRRVEFKGSKMALQFE
ncbi:MAG: hypothetical protein WBV94_00540 [Blastocatellia bacterium]